VAGRDFDSHDTPVSVKVAIVNRSMARKYFGAANPVGRRVSIQEEADVVDSYEIAGMVEDAKYGTLREQMAPTLYLTRNQDLAPGSPAYFELRAAGGPPGELVTQVKSVVGNLDRETSLEFTTLAARIGRSLSRERLLAALSGIFGAFALLLATIGLYGVMSYNVARRRSEIAIRLALGAEPARVLAMVMGEVGVLIAAGLGLGLGVALVTTRFVSSFLYGVRPNDPATLSTVAAVLAGVGAIAGYLPARRASRLDPMVNLREE
jgi:predicted lysophospholipase L1 biosynthesis ABC-type transport system permease subunit